MLLFNSQPRNGPKPQHFMPHSWYLWNALEEWGALTWFETVWSYEVEAIDY
jgi:hypothetical protein